MKQTLTCPQFFARLSENDRERLMPSRPEAPEGGVYIRVGERVFDAAVRFAAEFYPEIQIVRK